MRADGREHEFITHQLYVANGGFHAGRPITADADADDRLLRRLPGRRSDPAGAAARDRPQRGHRRTGARCATSRSWRSASCWLETDRPARVEVDGEPCGQTPLRIGLDANALRLMAPADAPDH